MPAWRGTMSDQWGSVTPAPALAMGNMEPWWTLSRTSLQQIQTFLLKIRCWDGSGLLLIYFFRYVTMWSFNHVIPEHYKETKYFLLHHDFIPPVPLLWISFIKEQIKRLSQIIRMRHVLETVIQWSFMRQILIHNPPPLHLSQLFHKTRKSMSATINTGSLTTADNELTSSATWINISLDSRGCSFIEVYKNWHSDVV